MIDLYKKQEDGSYYWKQFADGYEDCDDCLAAQSEGFVKMDSSLFAIGEDNHTYLKSDIGGEQYNKNITAYKNRLEVIKLKKYLAETDYVITKLNELKLEDEEEYENAKAEYASILTERKNARKRINELEA